MFRPRLSLFEASIVTHNPRNRHIVLAPCEEPRKVNPLLKGTDAGKQSLGYGVVEAVDDTPRPNGALEAWVMLNDLVYFRGDPIPFHDDDDNIMFYIHESQVLDVVRGVAIKRKLLKVPSPLDPPPLEVVRRSPLVEQ